jgi:hypothetical protein
MSKKDLSVNDCNIGIIAANEINSNNEFINKRKTKKKNCFLYDADNTE